MKTIVNRKDLLTTVFVAFLLTSFAFSQENKNTVEKAKCDIPGLTADQKAKIDELRIPHMKIMNNYKAELAKLEAELNQLEIADNVDMKKIDSKIDEIFKVKADMAKERSKHQQAVRTLLTPEQKVIFDTHAGKGRNHNKGMNCKGGHGQGQGNCQGKGPNSPQNTSN
jgi:Spy/CpxP family protein refolding chaperone